VHTYFLAAYCFLLYFDYTRSMEMKEALNALAALAHETRLAIFRLLVEAGPAGLPVGKIGERLGTAPATLSFHLKELGHAQLVTTRHEGRFIYCSANFTTMNGLLAYLTENCCGSGTACVPFCAPAPRHAQREEPS
jgi:ArsR family transcriptional regulator, arsenate/arsenite/antimonite-responsive transcriptional repressor